MEFLVCMLLASILTGGRIGADIIHAVKGTTPPHVEKAKLKAQQQPKAGKPRSPYADGKPRLKDVAAVYCGDAMADAIDLHNKRREDKKAKKAAKAAGQEPVKTGKSGFWQQFKEALVAPVGEKPANPPTEAPAPVAEPAQAPEGPVIACDECGVTLADNSGAWDHPAGSTCPKAAKRRPQPRPRPARVTQPAGVTAPVAATRPDRSANPPAKYGWNCPRCGMRRPPFGTKEDAQAGLNMHNEGECQRRQADNTTQGLSPTGHNKQEEGDVTSPAISAAETEAYRHEMFGACSQDPKRCPHCADEERQRERDKTARVTDNKENDMTDTATATSSATGDAHDVESAINECGLLDDDLTRIDSALDVIDEAITNSGSAAEKIEAFLASKNVADSAVGGMAAARDHLSPERMKVLIDAVAAAKQGVQAAAEELRRLQDLEQQLQGADGSVLNGR
ncbi:hypothetical protein [Paractinoplanes maris]|uniref:hypothetical protein n=1 Tax=Paractinoplanes maris TaxID=1734446 RepID=UPI0020214EDF|nr:hypothetical protein [Actinoplanes maris]